MGAARFVHAMAFVALFNGVLYLSLRQDAFASEREEEAKKYTEQLRKGKDTKSKIAALQELGNLAQIKKSLVADALPEIYRAVQDKDPGVRAAAAETLGKADEPVDKSVPLLVKLLKEDKDDSVKIGAANGLSAMGSSAKEAAPVLRAIVKATASDKKSKLGKAAKNALKAIGGKN
jgi:HEAT repeat protein